MQIHDVQPGTGGFLILSDRRGEQLPLEAGVPFLAEVLEQEDDRTLLAVAGRLLRCETAIPLEPGATVWLTVKEASAHRVVLAPFDPGAAPSPPGLAVVDAVPAGEAPAGRALARAVAFLLANGRPATPEAVQSVAPLLSGEVRVAETLSTLAELLPKADFGPLPPDAPVRALLDRLQTALEAAHFEPSGAGEAASLAEQAARLEEAVHRLGLDHEARLAAALEQVRADALPQALLESIRATPGTASLEEVVQQTEPVEPAGAALAQTDLKGLLLALRQVLASVRAASPAPHHTAAPELRQSGVSGSPAALERLAQAVDDAVRNLTGQRLLAPSGGGQGQERLDLFLQIPIAVGERRHTAELRLYREGSRRKSPRPDRPAALRLSCRLTTTYLGPVRLDLFLRPKGVSEAHLCLSGESVVALFRAHEPELRDVLRTAGLRLGRVGYSLAPPGPSPGPPAVAPTGPGSAPREAPGGRTGAIDLWL